MLKLFGAKVGKSVVIKPGVKVKFPWRFEIGDFSWIGEGVWIDNLDYVKIGHNACLSQGVYLCTGSHRWDMVEFDLLTRPIVIEDSVWVAAKCNVGPGVTIGEGAVLSFASTAVHDLRPWGIYGGNPAMWMKDRKFSSTEINC